MHRSFTVVMPADNNYHQLYGLLILIAGAVPTDGILVSSVCQLKVLADPANAAAVVTIADGNNANTVGQALSGGDLFERMSDRNTINLKTYFLKGNALTVIIDVESV